MYTRTRTLWYNTHTHIVVQCSLGAWAPYQPLPSPPQDTNYQFDVNADSLELALDR